jgi:hypothetical protein
MRSPNTWESTVSMFRRRDNTRGDWESPIDCSSFQSCWSPYTCPHAPPFIGRRRDFYIPTIPLNSKNIPNVNTHTQMSFTSHTFKSLPLVHTLNPDFLRRQLWLFFLLVRECFRSRCLHAPWFPNSFSNIFPNFGDSRSSWLRRFMTLSLQEFGDFRA